MFQGILSIFKKPVKRLGSGWTPSPPIGTNSKDIKVIYFKASITAVETPRKAVPPKGIKERIGVKVEIKKKVDKLLVLQKFL